MSPGLVTFNGLIVEPLVTQAEIGLFGCNGRNDASRRAVAKRNAAGTEISAENPCDERQRILFINDLLSPIRNGCVPQPTSLGV